MNTTTSHNLILPKYLKGKGGKREKNFKNVRTGEWGKRYSPNASYKNVLESYTMPQVEMYLNLLRGFALLSRFSLTSCFRAFNFRSLFCNLVIFLLSSAGFSIAYSFLSFTFIFSSISGEARTLL